jgi:uncharacterized protein YqjF (DUF2071 family)
MRLDTTVRDLLVATWYVPEVSVARTLPPGLEPALAGDGRALVSLVTLRNTAVRAGRRRAPSFSQLGVRTYVRLGPEPALLWLAVRVTPAGLAGVFFGLPLRPARIRVRAGEVVAKGSGVRLRYRTIGEARGVPSAGGTPLGVHEVALLVSAGLRRLASTHEPCAWQEAELLEPALAEPLLALGFDVGEPDSLLYAAETRFALDLPPVRIA